ncbi:MAG TPA: TetR/AcrR family transcriptional regulator [Enteractinococcus helveticum]|uniref:TetR/AcrR family transcriptional regulator n=1 Tax=Enteractinococcus helveticum TaxID=1837282 RepID=A0A921FL90_9MICC|nr:TetR/AcrR family transcriptional regulator [Enteractinococcus helveticum]HJF14188.1 TetR/AcrR family transcriptional regulator [Enteractinococcus helveticum]
MSNPVINTDLTAKARIRQVALELFALNGSDGTSMRAISSRAGVTVGLITHHFGTKAGLIQAVEDDLLDGIANAIAYQESDESVDGVVRKLDQRLLDHIDDNPLVAAYLRRMMLIEGNGAGSDLTERFTRLALRQIQDLRRHGIASTSREPEDQVMQVMLVKLGQVLMQPFVDQIAGHLGRDPQRYQLSLRKTRSA